MVPKGVDRRTAWRVRGDVLAGRHVDDPELRSVAEFYVDRLERTYDRRMSMHPLYILFAVISVVAFAASIWTASSADDGGFPLTFGLMALLWTAQAVFGPSSWRKGRSRLDVNRR